MSDFAVRVVAAAEAGGRHRFDLVGFSLGAAVSPWVGGASGLEVKPGVRVIGSPGMPLWVKPGSLATINALP